jgi:Flp pilus assembly protein TadD/quercetin dioxygenase-like cupin family protein
MIITDRFVFIHLHKTGGQSLNDAIASCIPGHKMVGYHFPYAEIPAEARDLPVVGIVRNPWDWYVSWYAFNNGPRMRSPLFKVVSNGGTAGFKATVSNLVNLGSASDSSERQRSELMSMLPDTLDGNRGVGLTKASIEDLAASAKGYYSWLFARMLGQDPDGRDQIGRFENLQGDFLDILTRLGVEETDAIRNTLQSAQRRNASRHSHYSHYYDDELRDLIARQDVAVVDRFDYQFESLKPPGKSYDFPGLADSQEPATFQKLVGREKNFLQLQSDFDVSAILAKIRDIPAEKWTESGRERLFAVHKDTQSMQLVHFEDFQYKKPEYRELYSDLEEVMQPVIDYISDYYRDNGFVVRMILAKLLPGGSIPKHTDAGYSLLNCHRVHIPLITSDEVAFSVGGEEINMRVGEFWEINNGVTHGVENRGAEDRIHLIVDWMPNRENKPEEEVLVAEQSKEADRAAINAEALNSMVARGFQLNRSGDTVKAESLYRQVLHADGDHVDANNLLGLLCLQSGRLQEAVQLIEKALSISPDDAQAHSNLGIAYRNLNQLQEAAKHFQESAKLAPKNPGAFNNLGGIYMIVGQYQGAAMCFKQALAIQPGLPDVHFNLGNALVQLQEYDEAIQNLEHCLRLRPDFAEARKSLEEAQAAKTC